VAPESDERSARIFHALAAAGLAAVLAASVAGVDRMGAAAPDRPPPTICLLRQLTGIPCPTCGMTRSFCSLGRGDLGAALRQHPLGPPVFLGFVLLLVRSGAIALTGRPLWTGLARALAWSVLPLAAALVAAWAWRVAGMVLDGSAGALWRASLLGRLLG
jgi:hypothetical protein